jgi:hypothetical protein
MTRLSGIIDAAGKGQAFRGIRIVDDDTTGTLRIGRSVRMLLANGRVELVISPKS